MSVPRETDESALLEREATLRAILATAVDGIVTIDAQGRIQSFNPAAERMFGFAAEEVIGRNIAILMPSPDREQHDRYIADYLRTGVAHIIGVGREVLGRRKDGTVFPIELAVSEVHLPYTRLFAGIIRDVTERRRVEERAAALGRILEESLNEIYIFDADTLKFIQVNRGARENLGYSMAELRQMTPLDLYPDQTPESFADLLRPLRNGSAKKLNFEATHRRKSGRFYCTECHLQMSDIESRAVFVSIVLDVSDRRRAEARLLQAERLAAIGQTVTGLAHESRNAFQRSQACLEMLELELEGRPEALELVARIQRALDHLHHLYEEVRDYAAPINLERQTCDLSQVWRDAWAHLDVAQGKREVQLCEQTDCQNLLCHVDRFAMEQVFRNIMENAIDACPRPGRIDVCCRAAILHDQPAIQVSFHDNGPGFEPEAREKVFDAFFTTKTKGTGLGMAIAKRIVEAHGGTIATGRDSTPGATIVVTLPRA